MTPPRPSSRGLLLGLFLIGCVVTAIAAAVRALERRPAPRHAKPQAVAVVTLAPPVEAIAPEAEVFRTRPDMLAIEPEGPRDRRAHPRTLKTFRYLRSYPGAPPRIPHGLTPEEFRTGACKTCHERGGYSSRFAAYVPVTPHPELGPCLQCHVGDGGITGISEASSDPNARLSPMPRSERSTSRRYGLGAELADHRVADLAAPIGAWGSPHDPARSPASRELPPMPCGARGRRGDPDLAPWLDGLSTVPPHDRGERH